MVSNEKVKVDDLIHRRCNLAIAVKPIDHALKFCDTSSSEMRKPISISSGNSSFFANSIVKSQSGPRPHVVRTNSGPSRSIKAKCRHEAMAVEINRQTA